MTGSLVSSLLSRGGSGGGSWPMSKVIVKANSLPTAEIKYVGSMYIYAGETTAAYKHGYIYEGTSTTANTKSVSFSPNTISCTGENFWAFWKSEEGAPNNYTEIVKGEMVFVGGNTWNLIGRNTNNEIVKSYQQYDEDWEALGFSFTGTFSEGDVVYFDCAINETDDIIYWWQRIDVQPAGTSSSTGIAVDDQLSFDSQNPVQNKVITEALEETGYDTWKKPDDWIDIRSWALDNSVYFLVGHSADYQTYPAFSVKLWIEDSGTYDVYIDGIKHLSSVASETISTLNWQTLALETGFEVTYPSSLVTHIVRVTPTNSAKSITRLSITDTLANRDGILWIHFAINYATRVDIGSTIAYQTLMEAITAFDNVLRISTTASGLLAKLSGLKTIPVLDFENKSASLTYMGYNSSPYLKKLHIKNLKQTTAVTQSEAFAGTNFEEIVAENSSIYLYTTLFNVNCSKLKKLPQGLYVLPVSSDFNFRQNMSSLENTVFDLTQQTGLTRIKMEGNSSPKNLGVKGVVVSPEAPFNGASPQINVSYTGLDRSALIRLFKSMPYNVGYTAVGSPTITDGVVSGFSDSNCLKTSVAFNPGSSPWEIVTEFTPSSLTFTGIITGLGSSDSIGITMDYKGGSYGAFLFLSSNGTSWNIAQDHRICNLSANTTYKIKVEFTGTVYNTYLFNDGWELASTINNSTPVYGSETFVFGNNRGSGYPFTGTINLNNTYIKVNGVPWFTGKEAMTKTCNIVGCTGTAELTQEDKNIVLNKGWELTVA